MTAKLKTYRSKRDFTRTAEPAGDDHSGPDQGLYVMHKHASSHDHFDLRLEQDGVLRSWALPKGPSLEPGEKRLAVETEDHPLEYGSFEGVIPEGEYGGGTSMLWDQGKWEPRGKPKPDRVDFNLHGEKLTGHWTLVRMHEKSARRGKSKSSKKNWLLIKRSDETVARPDDLSVVSGRTMEEIAREEAPAPEPESPESDQELPEPVDPGALGNARKIGLTKDPPVQLATLVEEAPQGEDWIHELKFDGYRLIARIAGSKVTLLTRNGKDWTKQFPHIAEALKELPVRQTVIDGEVVAPEADGSTSFRRLQEFLSTTGTRARKGQLVYQVFDLLYLDGHNLEKTPQLERKEALEQLLRSSGGLDELIHYSDHIRGQGQQFHDQVCEMGLEGMVSKNIGASYRDGRQRSWLKTKCTSQDEFVVGGFSRPSGARQGFGSLLLGAFDGDRFIYTGRVGSGFSGRHLTELHHRLTSLQRKTSPFSGEVPETTGVRWVKPEIVVDVEFTERTHSGALRHPVFRGLREDKSAMEVQMTGSEQSNGAASQAADAKASGSARNKTSRSGDPMVAGVPITHPDRILYPEHGITKLDVARYYEDVQDWILPHLADRPLSLLRCPEGLKEDCFFQKHPDKQFAKDVPRIPIREKRGGSSTYLYATSATDLVWLVQYGVLEFHPWGSRISDVDKPDTIIFDLDPGPNVSWRAISRAATTLRERLDSLGLSSFLQASGGKGLHLVVPIQPKWGWDEIKAFAHGVSSAHAQDDPKNLTTNMAKSKRRGRVFIDYLRNGRGNTSIARYSTRARENATVATPLRWDELTGGASSNRYTVNNLRRRLSALKTDPWEDYDEAANSITKAMLKQHSTGP